MLNNILQIKKVWQLQFAFFVQNIVGDSDLTLSTVKIIKKVGRLDQLSSFNTKYRSSSREHCWGIRNIKFIPWSRTGHFEKLSTAYSHEIFASLSLQSSTGLRTEAYWPRTTKRDRWMHYGTISGCWFFGQMRLIFILTAWLIDKIVAFGVQKIQEWLFRTNAYPNVWWRFGAGGIIRPFFENAAGQTVTVKAANYRDMIIRIFFAQISKYGCGWLVVSKDSVICHTAPKQFNYCMSHFLVTLFLVLVIRIGCPNHAI